jgi:hypothetical protein
MDQELCRKFNDEIYRHQKSLTYHARRSDWGTFEANAGEMFDYVESVEMSVLEEKFYRITKIVVVVLLVMIGFIFRLNPETFPHLDRVNELLTIFGVALACFQVYFLYNFRIYKKAKRLYYNKRREKFIQDIESDFKSDDMTAAA